MDKNNINFNLLSFHTVYEAKGDLNTKQNDAACFGYIFNKLKNDENNNIDYNIKIYKNDIKIANRMNNGCFLTKKDIYNHVKWLKNYINIKFKIKESKNSYDLNININGNGVEHKFALSWIRYLYEFPFNMFLLDAYKLMKSGTFRSINILNTFNVVASSSGLDCHGMDIHGIGRTNMILNILNKKGIKDYIHDGNNYRINNMYNVLDIQDYCYIDGDKYKYSFWDSKDEFNKRFNIYYANVKEIKNKKII